MKLYIDTAIISEIREIHCLGILAGITTNPSLIIKSGKQFKDTIIEICELVNMPVSAEVTTLTAQEMIVQGRDIAQWHPNVIVKLPITAAGIEACNTLSKEGISTNMTLCFSANQALLCARAGATYVSPFVGRLDDINQDGIELIAQIKAIYDIYQIKTEIIAASIRNLSHITSCAMAGADIATIPYALFRQMLGHPLTDAGLDKFMQDWSSVNHHL